ncbi:Alpha-1,3-mannosyl-glycoprotein 4-beta-N-acetylglucosaminyltransferase A [Eumeta japonica]|uniref:Alpha-1,3-mannosyl-glycoprotein 4-beta-N-acetylglucosaminyltransferase A n=1 Tax=Eumeta variegata TaxID=151549 RepID=A0A4C2AHU2_EUMVA|nr:Alpha-1,3-mannosyl-glycoprotein 4-beta-N-acetylglucosaminyltransferase A [Eumeta japonica]
MLTAFVTCQRANLKFPSQDSVDSSSCFSFFVFFTWCIAFNLDLGYGCNSSAAIIISSLPLQTFPKHVKTGLIEVISPPSSFYPNLDELEPTLGDPLKRVKWRTKQNLDAMFLMTYAQTKGAFYLMLEDDIIAKKNYMKRLAVNRCYKAYGELYANVYSQEIKKFASLVTISNSQWLILEFCHIGGIGKLFRSSSLQHFVTYVQLFYKNLPIDWLIESYLADKVCTIDKSSVSFHATAFGLPLQHSAIVLSALKPACGLDPVGHREYTDHTVKKAYDGGTSSGDLSLKGYLFRSSNVEHVSDKFSDTTVEVLPVKSNGSFVSIADFDEFGLAEGTLKKDFGKISAIRLNVKRNSKYWVILSK